MPANLFDLSSALRWSRAEQGLGKAMARGFAEAGADVVIASRHEEELKTALDEILAGTGRRGRTASRTFSCGRMSKISRSAIREDGEGRYSRE